MISVLIDDSGLVVAAGDISAVDGGHEIDGALYPGALGLSLATADQLPEGYVNGRWRLDGGAWVALEAPEPVQKPEPPPPVITARQFFIQLAAEGILTMEQAVARAIPAALEAAFEDLPPAYALAARITWATMTEVPRNDPLFAIAGPALGKTETGIDDFFRNAGAIP